MIALSSPRVVHRRWLGRSPERSGHAVLVGHIGALEQSGSPCPCAAEALGLSMAYGVITLRGMKILLQSWQVNTRSSMDVQYG